MSHRRLLRGFGDLRRLRLRRVVAAASRQVHHRYRGMPLTRRQGGRRERAGCTNTQHLRYRSRSRVGHADPDPRGQRPQSAKPTPAPFMTGGDPLHEFQQHYAAGAISRGCRRRPALRWHSLAADGPDPEPTAETSAPTGQSCGPATTPRTGVPSPAWGQRRGPAPLSWPVQASVCPAWAGPGATERGTGLRTCSLAR